VSRLVVVTQALDPDDPALAATIPKVRALAALVDELVVLALRARETPLPDNCRVVVFGGGRRAGRAARLLRALRREAPRDTTAILAHMAPVYAVLAAPVARPRGVPLLLWYTHWRATAMLRLAERLVTAVLSVERRSFPLDSPKVRAIGHGIDLEEFTCRPVPPATAGLQLLGLGRYSPAKGYPAVLEAVAEAVAGGLDVRLRLVGPALTDEERAHRAELGGAVARLGLEGRVALEGPVRRSEIPALLERCDALVNNMRAGAPDKVVYEAAASCVPVLASNPVFDAFLPEELRFGRDRPAELAERLRRLARLDGDGRAALGALLRERAAAHTSQSWAAGVLSAATDE
jgi:glycosyltransferase involved in cell wall biosynthesis